MFQKNETLTRLFGLSYVGPVLDRASQECLRQRWLWFSPIFGSLGVRDLVIPKKGWDHTTATIKAQTKHKQPYLPPCFYLMLTTLQLIPSAFAFAPQQEPLLMPGFDSSLVSDKNFVNLRWILSILASRTTTSCRMSHTTATNPGKLLSN